jgi:LuxR family maltose regulon positive regulatory protein
VIGLHTKASAWFEENGLLPLAIEHFLQIKNYEKVILLLSNIAEGMWENGQHSTILKYGDLLPGDVIRKNPEFSLFYAWVLITAGQIQKAVPFLESAEKITRQKLDTGYIGEEHISYQKKLAGKIAVAMAYQYSFSGKPEIILAYCQIALENLSEEDPLWFSWGWLAVGKAQLANENILESTEAFKKALAFGKRSGNIYLITTIAIHLGYNEGRLGRYKVSYKRSADLLEFLKDNGYGTLAKTDWTFAVLFANMAAIQYFWADLEGASQNIKTAYKLCIKEADITSKVLVLVIYSVILYGQGDLMGAESRIKEMDTVIQKNKVNPFLHSMYIGWKATFLIIRNQLEKARDFLEMHGVETGKTISYAEEYSYIPLVLLLMGEYKLEEAFGLLTQLYEMARAQNRIERMIELNIFFSIIFQAMGEKEKALQSLTESLEYAAPDEIIMYHLNYLQQINPLLDEVFKKGATGKGKLPQGFIHKLKKAIEKEKLRPPAKLALPPVRGKRLS